jgi:signal peptidase I
MMGGPASPSAPGQVPKGGRRPQAAVVAGIAAIAVLLPQLYWFTGRWLTADETFLAQVALQLSLLGLLLLAARLERRPLSDFGWSLTEPTGGVLTFAGLLAMLYLAIRLDPGFFLGFGRVPLSNPLTFGFLLLGAPLMAFAEVSVFFGYLFRSFTRLISLRSAILLAAGLFALYFTNVPVLAGFGTATSIPILFTTTVVDFVLGVVLAFYSYKSRWGLLGPVAFTAAVYAISSLLPVAANFPSWEVDFATSMLAFGTILVMVEIGLKEPKLQSWRYLDEPIGPRRYRFRDRARERAAVQSTLVSLAVVGVVAVSAFYALPATLGTPSSPILVIASGSMVPTFERGTLVVIHHLSPSAIHVGTIIAFNVACLPNPTVHRVVKIVSAGPNWVYQTKGDANPVQDPCTVPYSAVLGAVFLNVPYVGYLVLDPLFAVALVVLAFIVPSVWKGEGW